VDVHAGELSSRRLIHVVRSILYQRGIYPAESFKQEQKYGLNMLVTDDEKLGAFLKKFLEQLAGTNLFVTFRIYAAAEWTLRAIVQSG
jgi:hypothetical protein